MSHQCHQHDLRDGRRVRTGAQWCCVEGVARLLAWTTVCDPLGAELYGELNVKVDDVDVWLQHAGVVGAAERGELGAGAQSSVVGLQWTEDLRCEQEATHVA